MQKIQMVDLQSQFLKISDEVSDSLHNIMSKGHFIGGQAVKSFEDDLAKYLDVKHVIACGNGTDALQLALMSLDLSPDDEIIVPAFTYVATAEVIALLGLKPVIVDVDKDTYNISYELIADYISDNTRVIIPVHLFGQSSDMEKLMEVAKLKGIYVIEDNAQAIGAKHINTEGQTKSTGTIGDIGCLSFYPSKNLGAYGDGGALLTNDDDLAVMIRSIANHGQSKKYYHDRVGCNSRLDTMQASILNIKLKYLDDYNKQRNLRATKYDNGLQEVSEIKSPALAEYCTHVFHQYTIKVKEGRRDDLKSFLQKRDIPSMIYYPVPLYQQKAYSNYVNAGFTLPNTELLCDSVLSLPICPELRDEAQDYIIESIIEYFK